MNTTLQAVFPVTELRQHAGVRELRELRDALRRETEDQAQLFDGDFGALLCRPGPPLCLACIGLWIGGGSPIARSRRTVVSVINMMSEVPIWQCF